MWRSGLSQRHIAATCMSGLQITPCIQVGSQLRAQISSCLPRNLSENHYLRNRIFSPQQAAQIQSDLTLCDLWGRQNDVVQPKISTKILSQYTRIAKISCRFDSSPQPVAATSLLLFSDLRQNLGFTLFDSVFQWFC